MNSLFLIPSKGEDLGSYWPGFEMGSLAALCSLHKVGLLKDDMVEGYKEGMMERFENEKNKSLLDLDGFYKSEIFVKKEFPNCKI